MFLFQTLNFGRTRFHAKQHFRKVDMEVNQTATTRKNRHGGGVDGEKNAACACARARVGLGKGGEKWRSMKKPRQRSS